MNAANTSEINPSVTIKRAGRERAGIHCQQHLETQQRVERDIEQQPGKHRGDRRRAFSMRVRQPGVQRSQSDLGAVTEQQKHECDVEQSRIERAGAL